MVIDDFDTLYADLVAVDDTAAVCMSEYDIRCKAFFGEFSDEVSGVGGCEFSCVFTM